MLAALRRKFQEALGWEHVGNNRPAVGRTDPRVAPDSWSDGRSSPVRQVATSAKDQQNCAA
jgi:hypothetical protein